MEGRFASQPIPAALKNGLLLPLRVFPAQLPPGRTPACAPFGTKRHRLPHRTATRPNPFGSRPISPQYVWSCLLVWSVNRMQRNHVYRGKRLRSSQGIAHSSLSPASMQIVHGWGPGSAGKTACNNTLASWHQTAGGNRRGQHVLHSPTCPSAVSRSMPG